MMPSIVNLPEMEGVAVVGGGTTTARMAAGANLVTSSVFQEEFTASDTVTVNAEVLPEALDVGASASMFIMVKLVLEEGKEHWFYKDMKGKFQAWDEDLLTVEPAHTLNSVTSKVRMKVYEGPLRPGEYSLYLAYETENGPMIHSGEPFVFTVQ